MERAKIVAKELPFSIVGIHKGKLKPKKTLTVKTCCKVILV